MKYLALLLLACSSPQPTDAGADGTTISCEIDSRTMKYGAGMAAKGKTLQIVITSAVPSPPAKGTNNWVVDVRDLAGMHVSGTTLEVALLMPDHGHGSSVVPTITPQSDGTFKVDNLYFFMPGLWRITFVVHAPSGDDTMAFFFCIAG